MCFKRMVRCEDVFLRLLIDFFVCIRMCCASAVQAAQDASYLRPEPRASCGHSMKFFVSGKLSKLNIT